MKNEYLYIRVDKNNVVSKKRVAIKDVVKIYSPNKKMVNEINHMEIFTIKKDEKENYVFSILRIIQLISEKYPNIEIINEGEQNFIIHYVPAKVSSKLWEIIKTVFVCLIVFIGSAFAIMTFNNDVDVIKVFDHIYMLFTGVEKEGGSILELTYAIGLPLGIIIFYGHFTKIKLTRDPSPMQVQMRLYEEDLDLTVIENENREGKTIDVD